MEKYPTRSSQRRDAIGWSGRSTIDWLTSIVMLAVLPLLGGSAASYVSVARTSTLVGYEWIPLMKERPSSSRRILSPSRVPLSSPKSGRSLAKRLVTSTTTALLSLFHAAMSSAAMIGGRFELATAMAIGWVVSLAMFS